MTPNACIILQGFRHTDVSSQKLDTEPPTLSKVGRSLLIASVLRWAGRSSPQVLKSLSCRPTAPNRDIRVRLAKLIGLKDSQSSKVVKPEFGDVRAPRQSFSMVDRVKREELYFVRRQLNNCLQTRARSADKSDDRSRVFDNTVVEGVIGLRVDDLMGDGENVLSKADILYSLALRKWFVSATKTQRLFQRFRLF